tara:strand:+ start:510 stop:1721 length:1212 start_codon:yes stop_codon:yes gene_type:complete
MEIDAIRREILDARNKYLCLVSGRRWGKSSLALIWLLDGTIRQTERRWVIFPTYRQAKLVMWPTMKTFFKKYPQAKVNESELSITLNGATFELKGADNEDSLRGVTLGMNGSNAVVLDEYAYMKPKVFEEIVMPMLATSKGRALFVGTPSGYNHFHDIFLRGQGGNPNWKSWQFKTIEHGYVDAEEIALAKENMDARTFSQEFEATFETVQNRAAYNFDRNIHLKSDAESSPKVYVGMDFNVDWMTAVKVYEYTNQTIHYADEIRLTNSNTEEMAREIKKRWPEVNTIFPDSAGSARSTTGKSDHQILRDFGFRIIARKANPPVKDRLNALNRKLKDANGKISMTVDPKCLYLIKDLEQCQRDKSGTLDKRSDDSLSHALDACSYLIAYKWPIVKQLGTSVQW